MRSGWFHTLTSAPPAPWTPLSLGARLALWHDASMGVTLTAGAVSQWDDLSGNGRHATQPSNPARPAFSPAGINGMPALYFGGNKNMSSAAPWEGAAARSLFAVWASESTGGYDAYFAGDNSPSNSDRFALGSSPTDDPRCVAGSATFFGGGHARDGLPLLAEASFDGATARLSKNISSYTTRSATLNTANIGTVGSRFGGSAGFVGHIAAVLAVAGLATTEEVALIREYFRTRYSLW